MKNPYIFLSIIILLVGCQSTEPTNMEITEIQDSLDLRCKGYLEQNIDFIMLTVDQGDPEAFTFMKNQLTSTLKATQTTECSIVASEITLSENRLFADTLVTTKLKYKIIETGQEEMFTDSSRITFQKKGTVWQSLWEKD